jgi:hypothetical protein
MLFQVRFTTRISGIDRILYKTRYAYLEATSRKTAKETFEKYITPPGYKFRWLNGSILTTITWGLRSPTGGGWELGKYYLPKHIESLPVGESLWVHNPPPPSL